MPLIKNAKATIICGIVINMAFMALKFVIFIYSHVNLFFADTIDSFVDTFVIFMVLIFLRFNLNGKLTYLTMDFMLFSQWNVVLIFRVIILLDQVSDLIKPEVREKPLLIIISSAVIIVGSIFVAILFVDEDDVIKCFISEEEKQRKKLEKAKGKTKKKKWISPIFVEALDNLVSSSISLALGLLLYFNVIVDYIYLVDDVSNMVISVVIVMIACKELWKLSDKYKETGYNRLLNED
eukprot:TRINITY_DN10914_c0_g1_i2.p1 TRINITY_DN10914_c0_g1~~TRINITY_DN10914_c0_g1_i2.p1  ORF type:complete len:237 (+),score=31.67 TRINITY_DN10914_c0_g1_i2:87-797(+)